MKRRRALRWTIKGLCLLVIVFLSLEIPLRIALSSPGFLKTYVRGEGNAWMRLSWVSRHRDGVITTSPFDVYDPQRGWAVRPNVPRTRSFGNRWLSTNSQGLRGAVEHPYAKTPGRLRIATLGDSFTFGDQVSDEETYSALLEQQLTDAEVLNFGVHGYGHDQMLLYLQSAVVKYNPDIVIVGFVAADMIRNTLAFRDFAKPYFDLHEEKLLLRNVPVASPEEVLRREPYRLKVLDVVELFGARLAKGVAANRASMRALTSAILDEIVHTIQGIGARPLLVYLPVPNELRNPARTGPTWGETFFLHYCSTRNLECFSLRPVFARTAVDESAWKTLSRWGHWSEVGHRLAAPLIADQLVGRGWARKQR